MYDFDNKNHRPRNATTLTQLLKSKSKLKGTLYFVIGLLLMFNILPSLFWASPSTSSSKSVNKNLNSASNDDSKVVNFFNSDASLSQPFLDRVNEFWHIGGTTQIRNSEFIRLVKSGVRNSNGVVISNGIGDNIIDDFEITVKLRISEDKLTKDYMSSDSTPSANNRNDDTSIHKGLSGFAVMISPENNFIKQNLVSSYAKQQYMINSNGILGQNTYLMGVPRNLPGLALVYLNDMANKNEKIDVILNANPSFHWKTPGEIPSIYLTSSKFNFEQFWNGQENENYGDNKKTTNKKVSKNITLRIVYFESVGFLRIDIQNPNNPREWVEIVKQNGNIYLPKNSENDQRYISISGLNTDATQNIDIINVRTEEFHWIYENNIMHPRDKNYINEIKKFLIEKYDFTPAPGTVNMHTQNNNQRDSSSQENVNRNGPDPRSHPKERNWFVSLIFNILKYIFFLSLLVALYFTSLYLRVSMKHWKWIQTRKHRGSHVLPA
ncbi:hypothetical protein TBLA_0B06680 [Henningerozyma blattae CBS 6284]|uniref:L-type lectin-like domain-containing protein n=1 Tax=Henningerozyma blattae (strain ATCC 34711 / CBS 6284 / DSM 70876 / NBRC 10599 / NRRL Y-10934 / UCD 77-7) TaxID=1071380 RepID=I2GZD8_HENB6|nr:hypothetical protein TBLA_0B06680 [Tetrapisispora blattae CBS 6284]CCH59490.1 hypothetical protein TBLA_0B06680 [Tetrapisispora blattae CBS 6284]